MKIIYPVARIEPLQEVIDDWCNENSVYYDFAWDENSGEEYNEHNYEFEFQDDDQYIDFVLKFGL
jgi:hypothetical protein